MRKKKWMFVDDDIVVEPTDERYFEVVGGDLPGAIKVKNPTKKAIAEQFKELVDGHSQTDLDLEDDEKNKEFA